MFEWLEYDFMLRALAATSVLSFSIAPVGALLRRLSLAGEAMAHAIVPGIVIGFVIAGLSVAPMIIGGLAAGVTVALLTNLLAFTICEDASLASLYLFRWRSASLSCPLPAAVPKTSCSGRSWEWMTRRCI